MLLPSVKEVCEGYVFTHVCDSVQGGVGPGPGPGGGLGVWLGGGVYAQSIGGGWGVWPGGCLGTDLGGRLGGLARGCPGPG